jgi:hypothetical protein
MDFFFQWHSTYDNKIKGGEERGTCVEFSLEGI